MDAVVLGILLAVRMDAAARDDDDIRIFADVEIVVNQVIHIAVGDAGRDIDGFALGVRLDDDVDARAVRPLESMSTFSVDCPSGAVRCPRGC